MITTDEEVELTIQIRGGDEDALKKLVVANLRFVISVAKQYQNKGLSFSDLINEGNLGLVKAAQRFDETRGFKFISYAVWWIRQSIMQAISEQTRIVRLPLNRLSSIKKISAAGSKLEQEFEREPTDTEIADFLELSESEVNVANRIKSRQVSFDKPLSGNNDSDFSLYDLVQNGNIPSPDSDSMKESLHIDLHRALNKLSPKEASILTMYFGLFNSPLYSLSDIAMTYDTSKERINQIRASCLNKLKVILKGRYSILEE